MTIAEYAEIGEPDNNTCYQLLDTLKHNLGQDKFLKLIHRYGLRTEAEFNKIQSKHHFDIGDPSMYPCKYVGFDTYKISDDGPVSNQYETSFLPYIVDRVDNMVSDIQAERRNAKEPQKPLSQHYINMLFYALMGMSKNI